MFYDPHLPNGVELALGIARAATLEDLLRQTDTLSIHIPLALETRGMLGHAQLGLLPRGAVVVNTARGPIIELDALYALLRDGHIAAAGLDVLPVEPPVEPVPELLRAYRGREPWLEGRLVITPHAAWFTPESEHDTRIKSAETMRAALLTNRPQNVITPEIVLAAGALGLGRAEVDPLPLHLVDDGLGPLVTLARELSGLSGERFELLAKLDRFLHGGFLRPSLL
jgi:C-terminal binding protein